MGISKKLTRTLSLTQPMHANAMDAMSLLRIGHVPRATTISRQVPNRLFFNQCMRISLHS
ncbi:hypothetical protein JHK87_045395 [Glycine soja]|nr:hypothetical protein JHK87_045395 [Glycine soja]